MGFSWLRALTASEKQMHTYKILMGDWCESDFEASYGLQHHV